MLARRFLYRHIWLYALLLIEIVVLLRLFLVNDTRILPVVFAEPQANAVPPLYVGLDVYRHWDKLSYLEIGDRVEGQSTADLAGSNTDKSQYLRVLPDGEHVLFDQMGPGVATFLRMQEAYGSPWNLQLDGQPPVTIGPSDLGQVDPTSAPALSFPFPLSLNPSESKGSSILATALPFQQRMTWSSRSPNGNFYALYRRLPYGSAVLAGNQGGQFGDVARFLRSAGSDIAPGGLNIQSGKFALAGGVETPLTMLVGQRQIRLLEFRVPMNEKVRFGNARLRIYWDGEAQPSVDAPLKFLVGDGAGVYQPMGRQLVQGLLSGTRFSGAVSGFSPNAGVDQKQASMIFYLYWPMPFARSARIDLTSAAPLRDISWRVGSEPFLAPSTWWGTFHATYSQVAHPIRGQDMTFLNVAGSGKLVGTIINFMAPHSTLEGDPRIYVDDSLTPQIAVTGTEEWGLGGDYWQGGQQVSLPLGGLPSSVNNPPGADRDGAALYRFLIMDSIPFNRHLRVTWEHGGADESVVPYRATLLWYGTPAQTAVLNDEVLPAQAESRLLHEYSASGERGYALTSAYPYLVHSTLASGEGTATTGQASFTLSLQSDNEGAFLRRLFDYCVPDQLANVLVDGQFAGTWYDAGASRRRDSAGHLRCWREEDFPLPAALTRGKSQIHIQIQFAQTLDPVNESWTAFRYQLYSFVLPKNAQVLAGTAGAEVTHQMALLFFAALAFDEFILNLPSQFSGKIQRRKKRIFTPRQSAQ